MTKPPATELSLTRKTPSVLMWWARILLALSLAMAAWYQAWDLCTVAWVSVSRSATGAATRRLNVQTKMIEYFFSECFPVRFPYEVSKYRYCKKICKAEKFFELQCKMYTFSTKETKMSTSIYLAIIQVIIFTRRLPAPLSTLNINKRTPPSHISHPVYLKGT